MFSKLKFLMVLMVTPQIDLNSSYHYNKGINEISKSVRKIGRCKHQLYADTVNYFNSLLCGDTEKNPGPDITHLNVIGVRTP